jgi:hypothetical protein
LTDPTLPVHIVPRYLSEPEHLRSDSPWSYPREHKDIVYFDPERNRDLIRQLASAFEKRF